MDKELKVGETTTIKIKCVEDKNGHDCDRCIFSNTYYCMSISCFRSDRADKKDVHFEYVNE